MTTTYSATDSFTLTNAKKLAAKVVADMHQCRRFYNKGPSEASIAGYNDELVVMLAGQYVSSYEFGFETSDGKRVVSWLYRVTPAGDLEGGRSGGLWATADVDNAHLFNFMTTNPRWSALTESQRTNIAAEHSVDRVTGSGPTDGAGRWIRDRTYVSGGVAVVRQEFRPW